MPPHPSENGPSVRLGGTLPAAGAGTPAVLAEILAGGQSFLWGRDGDNSWTGVHAGRAYRIRGRGTDALRWELLHGPEDGAEAALADLFACDIDFGALADSLPWRSDPVLREALEAFPGLRILRQPAGEALLAFLLSPLKRIEQIRAGLLELSRRFGAPLGGGFHAPPSWDRLSAIPETELRACGIGYRAKGVRGTARVLAARPGWLDELAGLPSEAARDRLAALPGVGRKIADCVLLFGLGRLGAFPIDTWIARELRGQYGLEDFSDRHLQQFAAVHFGPAAGLAQQFLFARARRRGAGR